MTKKSKCIKEVNGFNLKLTREVFMLQKLVFLAIISLLISPNLLAAEAKSVAGMSFSVPDSWKETEPTSNMRTYQFEIPGSAQNSAELAVFYFGQGQGGDIQGNISRWKGQFTSVSKEESKQKTAAGMNITQVRIDGSYQQSGPMMDTSGAPKENYAMLGAIIEAPEGAVFFKMTGPVETINASAGDFDKVLEGLRKKGE